MKTFMKLSTPERAKVGWHLFTDGQLAPPLRILAGAVAAALVTAFLPVPFPFHLGTRLKLGAGGFVALLVLSKLIPADRYERAVQLATNQPTTTAV